MPVALDSASAQTVTVTLDLHADDDGNRDGDDDGDDRIRNCFSRYLNHRKAIA